ncbi:MFS transporter [Atopomonas sediminilitoris]|uniref:MFS transporter n=1 Tax=Atopomonas sediminilitoris TaxID=2919919 RepID=UPI001F4D9558|nr:MFS transporter [Atopomonas sediminilitoris]MCJ8168903.1 MFS transporter [Atopomonas sediminilitoris]
MIDPELDYLLAWSAYGLAAFVGLMVWFKMTAWISWRYVREPLRLLVAVLLFVPSQVTVDAIYAPSIAMLALDLLFKSNANLWVAVADLSMFGGIAFVVYFVLALIRFVWELVRGKPESKVAKAAKAPKAGKKAKTKATMHEPTAQSASKKTNSPFKAKPSRARYANDPLLDEAIRIDSNGERRLRMEPKL